MRDLLDRSWHRPRPTPVQRRLDVWIGLGAAVVAVLSVELYRSAYGADLGWRGVEAYVWFGLAGLLLVVRRSFPLLSLAAGSAVFVVIGERLGFLGATFAIQIILLAFLYAAWAWSRRPLALMLVSATVVAGMFGWLLWRLLEPGGLPQQDQGGLIDAAAAALGYNLAINIVYFFGAIAWGQVAYRGARQRAAAEQATALELALAEQRERQAIGDERVRIARDLHDVVAHHVSSIGIQASGAERILDSDPARARAALGTIRSSASETVRQMHEIVHLLRSDDLGVVPDEETRLVRSPQPGLADLPGLVTPDGVPAVEHRVVGTPFDVPGTVSTSLYRIAQEALANVHRHTTSRHVSITERYLDVPGAIELEVLDDGRDTSRQEAQRPGGPPGVPPGVPPGGQGGFGLAGIRERVAIHGGEAEIGPRPQGGFRVRVRIPVDAS